MYNVENHIEPKTVSLVHEILELIWCPVATGGSKEAGHMIPKTAVVSMFHDCHQFNAVVAKVFGSREQVIGKVGVAGNFSLERGYSNVPFVDTKAFWLSWSFVSPLVTSILWVPMPGLVVYAHFLDLNGVFSPR